MTEQKQAQQMTPKGYIIERTDATPVLYYSAKIGRDFASPQGGWTSEKQQATALAESAANRLLETTLASMAPHCKVVPL